MANDSNHAPRSTSGSKASSHETQGAAEPQYAVGPNRVVQQIVIAFLKGERKFNGDLSDPLLVGLHQALGDPQLVGRVLRASEAGAPLAANKDVRGKTIRQIVLDPAFDWTPRLPAVGHSSAADLERQFPVQKVPPFPEAKLHFGDELPVDRAH